MADTPEAKVKRRIREMLAGHYYQQPTTGGYGRSGVLDFTCCIEGCYLGIEAKSIHSKYGANGPTALQWEEINEIVAANGIAVSIDETNYAFLAAVLEALNNRDPAVARIVAAHTLTRHTRPNLTPTTETQPTIRKKS